MAFCNACGNNLAPGVKFCPKCGAVQGATSGAPAVPAPTTAPAQPQGSSALKIILIIVAVVVVLGIMAVGVVTYVGLRIARHTKIENSGGKVRVESPFGTLESNNNPEEVARDLGVEIYPGAHMANGKSANMNIGGMHTVSAEFDSDDSPDQVAQFYRAKFPNANVTSSNQGHTAIVSTANGNMVTITIDPEGGGARIHITNVSGKGIPGGSGR
jgi:hypothetical protein